MECTIIILFLAIALLMHSQIVGTVVVRFLALFLCVLHVLKNVQKSVRSEISKETKPK